MRAHSVQYLTGISRAKTNRIKPKKNGYKYKNKPVWSQLLKLYWSRQSHHYLNMVFEVKNWSLTMMIPLMPIQFTGMANDKPCSRCDRTRAVKMKDNTMADDCQCWSFRVRIPQKPFSRLHTAIDWILFNYKWTERSTFPLKTITNGSPSQCTMQRVSISLSIIYGSNTQTLKFVVLQNVFKMNTFFQRVRFCFVCVFFSLYSLQVKKNCLHMIVNEMFSLSLFGYCHLNIEECWSLIKLHQSRTSNET